MREADVTIGIPVYNEQRFIESAIRSAAPQCATLIVSDNASTDRSGEIARSMCDEYKNVMLVRQAENIGAAANFRLLLDGTKTRYFMWLGGHDMIPPGYVASLRRMLDENSDAVLAFGESRHVSVDGRDAGIYQYFYGAMLADPSAAVRLLALIRFLTDCSLIHGVFRTDALRRSWAPERCLGVDHILLSQAALLGRFVHVPETQLIRRDAHAADTAEAQLERVTGRSEEMPVHKYRQMQQRQYSLAFVATGTAGVRKWLYLLNVRYHLVGRFGPFAASRAGRLAEKVLLAVFGLLGKTGRPAWKLSQR